MVFGPDEYDPPNVDVYTSVHIAYPTATPRMLNTRVRASKKNKARAIQITCYALRNALYSFCIDF